jgi:bacterioferritin-associated ferredoxin
MIICVCHRISDRDIARMVRAGCASFDELQFESAVATCCGKCHDSARKAFDTHRSPAVGGPAAERADAAGLRRQRVIPIASPLRHDRTAWSAA